MHTITAHVDVASPGCFPTAASSAALLVAEGLVEPTGIIVDAMSGVSGAGRVVEHTSHFSEVDESVSVCVLTHRHTAEMELALTHVGNAAAQVLFTPHLVPMAWGIHATRHARPAADWLEHDIAAGDLPGVLRGGAVRERGRRPATDEGGDRRERRGPLTVRFDERTGSVLAIGVLDNLVKGVSARRSRMPTCSWASPRTPACRRSACGRSEGHPASCSRETSGAEPERLGPQGQERKR